MNWYSVAENDWEVYHDSTRIHKYVEYNKISTEQYQTITGDPYL